MNCVKYSKYTLNESGAIKDSRDCIFKKFKCCNDDLTLKVDEAGTNCRENDNKISKTWKIIGIITLLVIAFIGIGAIIYCVYRRKRLGDLNTDKT